MAAPADAAGIAALLGRPAFRAPLRALAAIEGLRDAWIGAGFVRNAVWDALHGRAPVPVLPGSDLDVVHFDRTRLNAEADAAIEAALRKAMPDLPWSVRNQARMHLRNGDAPYADTAEALRHWPETATAIAARLGPTGEVELLAPFGLGDLLGLVLRPTPACAASPAKHAAFAERVASKGWLARWPRLRLVEG